jgi:sulfite reductase (NADPH) hemoprotein beta-component
MSSEFPQMLTANRLRDGAVVYLAATGAWSEAFAEGAIVQDAEAAERAVAIGEEDVGKRLVVGPYLMAVRNSPAGLEPASVRERIRAGRGPTFAVNAGSWAAQVGG